MIDIGQNFIQEYTYLPSVSASKDSLFLNWLINLTNIVYIWYDYR